MTEVGHAEHRPQGVTGNPTRHLFRGLPGRQDLGPGRRWQPTEASTSAGEGAPLERSEHIPKAGRGDGLENLTDDAVDLGRDASLAAVHRIWIPGKEHLGHGLDHSKLGPSECGRPLCRRPQ